MSRLLFVDMRHRSTPVTEQRYALAIHRVKPDADRHASLCLWMTACPQRSEPCYVRADRGSPPSSIQTAIRGAV